jgi:hypothetical protein
MPSLPAEFLTGPSTSRTNSGLGNSSSSLNTATDTERTVPDETTPEPTPNEEFLEENTFSSGLELPNYNPLLD